MTIAIFPYRVGSEGARQLATAMGARLLRVRHSKFRPRSTDTIINWGNAAREAPIRLLRHGNWLNHPTAVLRARNKLTTFCVLSTHGVPTVEWTTDTDVAKRWRADGCDVVVRTTLTGQGGAGILILDQDDVIGAQYEHGNYDEWPEAPLYTKFWRAAHEYRAHVLPDGHVFVQKKRRRSGRERAAIRNWRNGYVYCTHNITWPPAMEQLARTAVAALGLDFGAVDILCDRHSQCKVLEVNTAPGLEGTTLDVYAEHLL